MENNLPSLTGLLKLREITPVIRALFGVFLVKEHEEGEAFIMRDNKDTNHRSVAISIAKEFELQFEDDIEDVPFVTVLLAMAEKLGKEGEVTGYLTSFGQAAMPDFDPEENIGLSFLFELAILMDDTHCLQSLQTECAWTSDKMRHGEFGGCGTFIGKNFAVTTTSTQSQYLGSGIDSAIRGGDLIQAASHIDVLVNQMLDGITNDEVRNSVMLLLIKSLQNQPATV